MKSRSFFISFILFCFSLSLPAQQNALPLLKVQGNKIVNDKNETLVFHGVNLSDPDKLDKAGKWTKDYFQQAKNWGSQIIRIPIHPAAWRTRGAASYLNLLDDGVQWASELGMYVILDWHTIGNLRTELYQNEMYNTTRKETFEFWKIMASHFRGNNAVAFYEIFNEPATAGNTLGTCSWSEWKTICTDIIRIILANNPKAIPLVAGFDWAYDLTPLMLDPLDIPGIAYVSHPYPEKRGQPWEPQWERDFGFAASKYPVFATEIGFALPTEKGVHVPVHGDEDYGRRITDYFQERGISWVVWVFDPDWAPMMFKDWNYTPTHQGEFFRSVMLKLNQNK